MPIKIFQQNNKICGQLTCEICKDNYGVADQDWLQGNGFLEGQSPKINLYCKACNLKIVNDLMYRDRNLVQQSTTPIRKVEENIMANKNEVGSVNINWNEVDELINKGQCKVNLLKDQYGLNPVEFRTLMVSHYGDRIVFKRGRTGGVYWANTQTKE